MGTPPNPASVAPPVYSPIQTIPSDVTFQRNNVPPTQYLYLQKNDVLNFVGLTNSSGTVAQFRYRYLTPQGEIKEGTRLLNFSGLNLADNLGLNECWLISFCIQMFANFPASSWAYLQIGIQRDPSRSPQGFTYANIWQGYLSISGAPGWPNTQSQMITDGAGVLRSITGSVPGAGADISESVPIQRRWNLFALTASLTTSATVANRTVTIAIDDGTNIFYRSGSQITQAAGFTNQYGLNTQIQGAAPPTGPIYLTIPLPFPLKANFRIRTITNNLQAGDQWTAPQYLVQEWGQWDN